MMRAPDGLGAVRRKYEAAKKGEEDLLALRGEIQLLLDAARTQGSPRLVEELEDMLIDLQFAIEDDRCKCHRKTSF